MELAVRPETDLINRSATDVLLRTRFGINLLALSRQGERSIRRLRSERFQAGDVLLVQGPPTSVMIFANEYGCVPLAPRALRIPNRRQALTATLILATTVAVAALGLLPAAIAFALGVLACLAFRVVSPRNVYEAVDWPVIVLLGALIPVAGAMASTGTADLIARVLLDHLARGHPLLAVTLILVVAMTLSDFMNNAATAAVMCPVAISAAARLEARPDAFLMAVAIGASCAFLTPIGHQNNTLILRTGRVPLRRLLAAGTAPRTAHHRPQHPAALAGVAAVIVGARVAPDVTCVELTPLVRWPAVRGYDDRLKPFHSHPAAGLQKPGVDRFRTPARPGAHQQAALSRQRIPPPHRQDRFHPLPVGADVGREVVRPERAKGRLCFRLGDDARQADLEGDALPHDPGRYGSRRWCWKA
ncbi:MAG: SLC13 family permease [Verrucomicrobia bacterium]|nr:SLC13 family permease [Verrucomicrobiota bacterium]